ncbi:helix-turn-helix domain-containing protein [Xanthobacter sp. DSM 24535]|uniref:helix-turn-helix domain-containing protein n=1 Tax=Roseixanthobacter psychrophilus TaxID=3119917 RepID=UPI003729B843
MATIRKSISEIRDFKLSQENKTRLDAVIDADIERAAADDSDNPIASDEELSLAVLARSLRMVRKKLSLTQEQFSARFEIPLPTVRDWEQGRRMPETPSRSYLKAIINDPDAIERALHKVA